MYLVSIYLYIYNMFLEIVFSVSWKLFLLNVRVGGVEGWITENTALLRA